MGPRFGQSVDFRRFSHESATPWAPHFDTFSVLFSFRGSRTLKKGDPGGPPNPDPFFLSIWGVCSEGLRRVHSVAIAPFSLLQAEPKRAPKWSQNGVVWGTKFATILLCGRLGGQIGIQNCGLFFQSLHRWGGGNPARGVWPLDPNPSWHQDAAWRKEDGNDEETGVNIDGGTRTRPDTPARAFGTVADIYTHICTCVVSDVVCLAPIVDIYIYIYIKTHSNADHTKPIALVDCPAAYQAGTFIDIGGTIGNTHYNNVGVHVALPHAFAGAVDREFVSIFRVCLILGTENVLTEGRERLQIRPVNI